MLKLSLERVICNHIKIALIEAIQLSAFRLLHRWQKGDWDEVEATNLVVKESIAQNSKSLATECSGGRIVGIYPVEVEPTTGKLYLREHLWVSSFPFAGKGANTTTLLMSEF